MSFLHTTILLLIFVTSFEQGWVDSIGMLGKPLCQLVGLLKKKGFDLESKHMINPAKLEKLFA